MLELCSHCGKTLTPDAERCPHCDTELAVTLPGTQVPAGEEGKVPLPAPEAGSDAAIEELFDDFDPMEEFAPPSAAGDPTLGGLELTPPAPAAAGGDVLDFIDTGLDEKADEPPPAMPEEASEVGLIGFEEAAEEAAAGRSAIGPGQAHGAAVGEASARPADWPDYLDPPAVAPPAPPSPEAPSAAEPLSPGAEEAPRKGLGALSKKQLRLLVAGGVVGGLLGVAPLLISAASDEPSGPAAGAGAPVRTRTTPAIARAEVADAEKAKAEAAAAGEREDEGAVAGDAEAPEVEPAEAEAPENHFAAAEALEAEEKWEEALDAYLEAAGPEKGALDEAHLRRSRILLRLDSHPRALLEAQRAVKANEARLEAWLHLGALFERIGSLRDALETYEEAVDLHPEAPGLLERLARTHLEMGAPWEAIRLLEAKVGADAPAGLRLALGEAYLGAGSWARAARTLAPLEATPAAAYPLARALLELGKLREALPLLERAAAGKGADPLVHRHLGYVYKELRRRDEAARAFRSYLDAAPEALDRREIEDEIATLAR